MMIDLIGKKFGRLKVIKRIGKNKWRDSLWLCGCNCENEIIVVGNHLKSGHTKSCGCLKTKHGYCNDGIYNSWQKIIQRCTNPNDKDYKYYGGRGIVVYEKWLYSFLNFLKDMLEGWEPGLTIERRNKNGNYCRENCEWATRKEQARNRRDNCYITYQNKRRL
ncbi:MAG: hypothetical protein QQN41_10300 [Nitrosopumilus sp.]